MVGAIILAAGAGKRMGMPKAQLSHHGRSYLEMVTQICHAGGCEHLWIVTRPGIPEEVALSGISSTTLTNTHPERGMFSSVLVGLAPALQSQAGGFLLYPVDHPHVHPSTIRALAGALSKERPWVCPTHSGQRGHPIAIHKNLALELAPMDPGISLRDALRLLTPDPYLVPVDDPGVLRNVNVPRDKLPE